jgi:hypothetical protein
MENKYWLGAIICVILSVSTVIPSQASEPSFLGYYAHCSFTPISSIILFALAGGIIWYGYNNSI